MAAGALKKARELGIHEEVHVFGEHAEDAAHQEARDVVGVVRCAEAGREVGEALGGLFGDTGLKAATVQVVRRLETVEEGAGVAFVRELGERELDAVRAEEFGVGVVAAGPDPEVMADVDDNEGRGRAFGENAGVEAGLAFVGTLDVGEPRLRAADGRRARVAGTIPATLGFEDEVVALVEVDAPLLCGERDRDELLEAIVRVGVALVVGPRGPKGVAELEEEGLGELLFVPGAVLPLVREAGEPLEGVGRHGAGVGVEAGVEWRAGDVGSSK